MYVLALETSCDETAAAIIERDTQGNCKILAEEISSQAHLHQDYGGVVPELAAREHLRNLPLITDLVLTKSAICPEQLGAVVVTRGPGLKGCLLMGLGFAKALSLAWRLPLVGVNHIEAHLLSVCMDNSELKFPFVCLVVSGGHTELHLVQGLGHYKLLARTSDDAAGEAFDKSANLLGFMYPGGAKLAALADSVSTSRFSLPRVMREAPGFSFSGLKTAVSLLIKKNADSLGDKALKAEMAYAIQNAIVETLCFKLEQACRESGIGQVGIVGGVSANNYLRQRVQSLSGLSVYFPHAQHSVDNAAMVAYVGALRFLQGERLELEAEVRPDWRVENI